MRSIKKALLIAIMFLSGFSQAQESATTTLNYFECRLAELNTNCLQHSERLHQLFNLYWDWLLFERPELATFYGHEGRHDQWSDYSPQAVQRYYAFLQRFLNTLHTIPVAGLSEEDLLNYQLFDLSLKEELEEADYDSYMLAVTSMDGIQVESSVIISFMPRQTLPDYQNILSRLNRFPQLVDQTVACLDEGLKRGITPPKVTMMHVPEQVLNQMVEDPLDSPFLEAFQQFPSHFTKHEQLSLLQEAKQAYTSQVKPALSKLYTYLMHDYIPNCRSSIAFSDLPCGNEWYASKVRQMTKTHLSPQQIHVIGLAEVKRIQAEILEIMSALQFEGSFAEFLQFMKTDPQFFHPDRDSILKGYRELTRYIESQLPLLFHTLPKLPFEVVPVPTFSEDSQIGAYYYHGSAKHNRPGYFFINTSSPHTRAKWEMEPLALHEAVPGHHLQIALSQEMEGIPEFRRHFSCIAYIEGWGLYSEGLGKEFGLYRDPYSQFGRLSCEMFRAIRLVVDTGMHAMGWSRQQAIDFFKQHDSVSDQEVITEVDRYLVMPAQALAYKMGELKIKELRQLAKDAIGEKFDIRDFHDEWLKRGTLPLNIAEQYMRRWIAEQAS